MKFNIYYESLEQGIFYIQESLKKIDSNYKVNLVKKRQQTFSEQGFKANYSKALSRILIRKNPDLIISYINNNIEYPIIVLEFSTAVFTKDHEQQRADNFLIPINNNCIYVKVSPIEKDSGNHGGDTNYNYLEPFSLCYKKYNELSFHINWEVEEDNKKYVKKHSEFRSLPDTTEKIFELLKLSCEAINKAGITNWKNELIKNASTNNYFKEWVKSLKDLTEFENIRDINSSRTNFEEYNSVIDKHNIFTLKLNRMGHAMDPERGMLTYYNTFFKEKDMTIMSKFIFDISSNRWYKSTPKEQEIRNNILKLEQIDKEHLIEFLVKGLSIVNGNNLISLVKNSKAEIINIDEFITDNYSLINNSFRTIIDHSSFLHLTDGLNNSLYLNWSKVNFNFDYSSLNDNTTLTERISISEDDVTYLTIHEVFKKNNIIPLSVSYPGAQSDMPILPEPKNGRQQKRIYIDNIGQKEDYLILQENKGKYTKSSIKSDIDKIAEFKTNSEYKKALITFVDEHKLETKQNVIGVGFGESNTMSNTINEIGLDKLDYFLIIDKEIKNWKLFSNVSDNIFKIKKGEINLPKTYEIPNINRNPTVQAHLPFS